MNFKSRRNITWEPTYCAVNSRQITLQSWDFSEDVKELQYATFFWSEDHARTKFDTINFSECDFKGKRVPADKAMVFEKCNFKLCDFSLSTIKKCKFTDCTFEKCTFSLCTFDDVTFRICNWSDIYFSGSETDFISTYLSNPNEFVRSHFVSKINPKNSPQTPEELRKNYVKSKRTQATTARNILNSHSKTGEDEGFYQAVEAHLRLGAEAKLSEHLLGYDKVKNWKMIFWLFKLIMLYLDLGLVNYFGWLNKWGASISKPIAVILISAMLFACIASVSMQTSNTFVQHLGRSAEIASLAGYTRYNEEAASALTRVLEFLQLLVSLSIHSVLFATIVARISRVR